MEIYSHLRLLERLWHGDNDIWLAQTENGELFAVKMPGTEGTERNARRLLAEAWFLQALARHKHIVPLLGLDLSTPARPVLVFPHMSGGSLRSQISARSVSTEQSVQIMALIADTVHEVHARGIVHLDIKPSNILLDSHGTPFLTDFGFAAFYRAVVLKTLDDEGVRAFLVERASATGGGTWAYMSPEQFAVPPSELSPAADVYSLGITLFEALTGRPPYKSLINDLKQQRAELRRLHEEGAIPSVLECNPDLVHLGGLQTVVSTSLQPDPKDRYSSAAEFALALRSLLDR